MSDEEKEIPQDAEPDGQAGEAGGDTRAPEEAPPEAEAEVVEEEGLASAPEPEPVAAAPVAASTGEEGPSTRSLRKIRVGLVTSDKMQKTIVVDVVRRVPHPKFRKIIKRTTTLYAHDENGSAKVGDKVRIIETKRISKSKCWRLVEVLEH